MSGFTKLFSSITDSSIWFEPDSVRLVWITMLAMSNSRGVVESSDIGIAYRARVSNDEAINAIKKLESSDPNSRSKEFEGRRIEKIDGGWKLLNYIKYREKRCVEERRAYQADLMRKRRNKDVNNTANVSHLLAAVSRREPPLAQAEAEAEAEEEGRSKKRSSKDSLVFDGNRIQGIPEENISLWEETYRGVDIKSEILKAEEWLRSNPRKLKKNYRSFLTKWFARSKPAFAAVPVRKYFDPKKIAR